MPTSSALRDSRVLLFSQRHLSAAVWQAAQYEFEDLLLGLDDVSLLAPHPQERQHLRRPITRLTDGVRHHTGQERRHPRPPSLTMDPVELDTEHELFFAVFHHANQLSYLRRIKGWRERCRHAVCVIIELWSPQAGADADYLEVLHAFDKVYVFSPSVLPTLRKTFGSLNADFLPMAVDAKLMSPQPHWPERVLDVYSYGRRSAVTHDALLHLVRARGLTYLYDTIDGLTVRDHREHRLLLASMMQRARYFLAYRINDTAQRSFRTGGDEGLSTRYFEGAAGGAVMLGSAPATDYFDECFPWPDAVLPLPYDSPDVADALADLDKQPERLAQIRVNNVRGSLSRHDWAHRWAKVLEDCSMSPLPALQDRLVELEELRSSVKE